MVKSPAESSQSPAEQFWFSRIRELEAEIKRLQAILKAHGISERGEEKDALSSPSPMIRMPMITAQTALSGWIATAKKNACMRFYEEAKSRFCLRCSISPTRLWITS